MGIKALSSMTLGIMSQWNMALGNMTLGIMTLGIVTPNPFYVITFKMTFTKISTLLRTKQDFF